MTYKDAYEENHVAFEIADIVWEEDYQAEIQGESDPGTGLTELQQSRLPESQQEEIDEFSDLTQSIQFEYEAPAIATDTAGRFISHEIIGGSTVRQKIGEDPVEVTVNGVCREPVAKRLDNLRNAKYGTIFTNRLPDDSLRVHFASTSTTPLEDSGAVALTDDGGEFLYTYTLNCVEVVL